MRRSATLVLLVTCLGSLPAPARAEPWIFKYDEFPEGLAQAATQVDGGQFYTQPGFVRGEAFGQIYRPAPEMFPLQILGFDSILAAPPFASGPPTTNAVIEVYNSESKTPDPGTAPIFAISTADLFNPATQEFGFPLQGNHGLAIEFDMTNEDNRPPMLTGGNIWLMIRFSDEAMSLSSEWNSISCFQVEGLICGCQNVGTLHDQSIVPNANVIHHVAPIGACSGPSMAWSYMEDVPSTESGFTIDGDVILRLRADVAAAPCVPECDGAACGDDGCGGSCGSCGAGLFCVGAACVACQPDCLSKQCGDDGCGGSCGSCATTQSCGADYFCHDVCQPSCGDRACGDDGCGGSCGTCGAGLTCDAGRCEAPCVPDCQDKECGPDGCGEPCGACGASQSCVAGLCEDAGTCAPDCTGRTCGDDGCGGACGSCGAGMTCQAGSCAAAAPDLAIADVSPDETFAMTETAISITGSGFYAGAQVKVGASDCDDEVVTGDGLISATVPGLAVGNYSVIVVNPDQRVATLADAFMVYPRDTITTPTGGSSDDGCAGGGSFALGWSFLAGLAARRVIRRAAFTKENRPARAPRRPASPHAHVDRDAD